MSRQPREKRMVGGQLHLWCPDCEEWLPETAFYKGKGYHSTRCKPHHNEDVKRRRGNEEVWQITEQTPGSWGYPSARTWADMQANRRAEKFEGRRRIQPGPCWWA